MLVTPLKEREKRSIWKDGGKDTPEIQLKTAFIKIDGQPIMMTALNRLCYFGFGYDLRAHSISSWSDFFYFSKLFVVFHWRWEKLQSWWNCLYTWYKSLQLTFLVIIVDMLQYYFVISMCIFACTVHCYIFWHSLTWYVSWLIKFLMLLQAVEETGKKPNDKPSAKSKGKNLELQYKKILYIINKLIHQPGNYKYCMCKAMWWCRSPPPLKKGFLGRIIESGKG